MVFTGVLGIAVGDCFDRRSDVVQAGQNPRDVARDDLEPLSFWPCQEVLPRQTWNTLKYVHLPVTVTCDYRFSWRPETRHPLGTGVTGDCGESNSGPLEGHWSHEFQETIQTKL